MTAFGPTGQILPLDDFMAEAGTGRGDFPHHLWVTEDVFHGHMIAKAAELPRSGPAD